MPLGYLQVGKKPILPPQESIICQRTFELFLEHQRLKTVAKILNQEGYLTRNGAKFSDTTIRRLLQDRKAKKLLVPKQLWDKCQDILKTRNNGKMPAKRAAHVFSGFVSCHCGDKMYVSSSTPKYVCRKCLNKINIHDLERIFQEQLKGQLLGGQIVSEAMDEIKDTCNHWPELTFEEKRKIAEDIIESIVVEKDNIIINLAVKLV